MQVVQAYLGLKLGVWAYNRTVKFWEPVVEPWGVIAKCDANTGPLPSNGIEPGVHVNVKSSMEMVHSTLAFSHVNALLAAYVDWQVSLPGEGVLLTFAVIGFSR